MINTIPGFVFLHGAWHNADTWTTVISKLREQGFVAEAIDLPGAGIHASNPVSYGQSSPDRSVLATELSANVEVTQEQRNTAASAKVAEVAFRTNGKVILVGHSMNGITVSPVTEAHPEQIAAAVYVTALMLPGGVSAMDFNLHPVMAGSEMPSLFVADPTVVGALRIDFRSADPAYAARLKEIFYTDVDDATYLRLTARLHADEPAGVLMQPSTVTPERFGTVPRYFVRCTEDRVVVPAAQDHMIAIMDAAMPIPTVVHTLHSSHSPFASQPQALADILMGVARQQP